ncbi:MAG: mechanosensitive ion channel domain-containing protein [Sphingomicrobium sp.]
MRDKINSWAGLWDWLVANSEGLVIGILIAAALVAVMLVMRHIGERILAAYPDGTGWRGVIANVLARTTFVFMVAAAIAIVTAYAEVPVKVGRAVQILFIIASSLQAAVWARELIIGMVRSRVGENPGESTLGNAMALIRVMVSVAAFALALVVILDNLGVNVTTLIAGLGIGGIAIGLAAQGIFSDLFAALSIVFDQPFRRGQTIQFGATTGAVERIGLKTTRIRSITGEMVVMSNTKLLECEIHNISATNVRRIYLSFGVIYQTAPDVLAGMAALAEEVIAPIKGCRLVRCVVKNFADSSIDFELLYEDKSKDFNRLAEHKSAVWIGLARLFKRDGIELAYPTQTTFTSAPDGTMIMPYPQVQQVVAMKKVGEDI